MQVNFFSTLNFSLRLWNKFRNRNDRNFDEMFSFCEVFSFLLHSKGYPTELKYQESSCQINHMIQNEPKYTKIARTQLAKMNQNEPS